MKQAITPLLVRYGGASKSSFEMNAEELKSAADSILRRAKEKAFYKGLPIYYANKNAIIAEYADGRKLIVKKIENAANALRHSRSKRYR